MLNYNDFLYRGIGQPISNDLSDREIMELGGFSWEPVLVSHQYPSISDIKRSPFVNGVLRSDTGKEIAAVSKNWKPYSNAKFVSDVRSFSECTNFPLDRAGILHCSSDGSLGHYLTPFISLRVRQSKLNAAGEAFETYLIVGSQIAFNHGIFIELATLRLVCLNGFVIPTRFSKKSISHSKTSFKEKAIENALSYIKQSLKIYTNNLDLLANSRVDEQLAFDSLLKIFKTKKSKSKEPSKKIEQIYSIYLGEYDHIDEKEFSLYQKPYTGTFYGLFNAITAFNNHFRSNGNSTSHTAFNSLIRGLIAKESSRAFLELLDIANKKIKINL